MTIQEFYTAIGGNYDDIMRRLRSERTVRKFLKRFQDDKTFESLKAALADENQPEAFRAAHTLKGLGLNLGFPKLTDAGERLTEAVRTQLTPEAAPLFEEVQVVYQETMDAISQVDMTE